MENLEKNPKQNPCKILEAFMVIRDMNQKEYELLEQLKIKKTEDLGYVFPRLEYLIGSKCSLRRDLADEQKNNVEPLKITLDKICFRNKSYQSKVIKSCLSKDSKGEINILNLHLKMEHGHNKSMAAEKKLFKEINFRSEASNNNSEEVLKDINRRISSHRNYVFYPCRQTDEERKQFELEREKSHKELELKRDKAISNGIVKGKNWWKEFGSSKEEIQEKIHVHEKRIEQLREEVESYRPKIKRWEKKLKAIENDVVSIQFQIAEANRLKDEAYKDVCYLRKQHEQMNCYCVKFLSTLDDFRELDMKEDELELKDVEYRFKETIKLIYRRSGIIIDYEKTENEKKKEEESKKLCVTIRGSKHGLGLLYFPLWMKLRNFS